MPHVHEAPHDGFLLPAPRGNKELPFPAAELQAPLPHGPDGSSVPPVCSTPGEPSR